MKIYTKTGARGEGYYGEVGQFDVQPEVDVGVDGVAALLLEHVGLELVGDADAPPLVAPEVHDDAAVVDAVLDALSAPAGAEDTRTREQRYHDALQEAMRRLGRQ